MKTTSSLAQTVYRSVTLAVVCAALSSGGCGLDEQSIPDLGGPSTTGTQLKLTATPDVITADGFSTSLIRVEVFDQNGDPAPGRTILLALADQDQQFADLGSLYSPTGNLLRAAEATVVTGGNGAADAVYTAPPRTDFTRDGSVTVRARPVGTDFNGDIYNFLRIELKSAEPRLFPVPGGALTCNFVVEAPQGSTTCSDATTCSVKRNTSVLFQDASTGDIVRYDWYFGDGSPNEDSPDTNHVFRAVGVFTVTHRVTDRNGAAAACSATITVSN
jgi:PKD domain